MWEALDRIAGINLLERTDRHESFLRECKRVGILNPICHRADISPHGATFGCCESHLVVIQSALADGCSNLLILEDDVVFNEGWEKVMSECISFLAQNENEIDILFCGSDLRFPLARSVTHPTAIWNAVVGLTHACIFTQSGMEKFVDCFQARIEAKDIAEPHDWTIYKNMESSRLFAHKDCSVIDQRWSDTNNIWYAEMDPKDSLLFQERVWGVMRRWCDPWVKASLFLPLGWRFHIREFHEYVWHGKSIRHSRQWANGLVKFFFNLYFGALKSEKNLRQWISKRSDISR